MTKKYEKQATYEAAQKERGFVRANIYVPAEKLDDLRAIAAQWREDKKNGVLNDIDDAILTAVYNRKMLDALALALEQTQATQLELKRILVQFGDAQ